jgi:hypothetical protein
MNKRHIEGLERYNDISNGGFFCKSYIEDNGQFLEIGLSNYGIATKTTIFLNKNVIDSLYEVLNDASYQRNIHNLDERDSYTVNTPAPDRSKKSYLFDDPEPGYTEKDETEAESVGCKECDNPEPAIDHDEENRDQSEPSVKEEVYKTVSELINLVQSISKYVKK